MRAKYGVLRPDKNKTDGRRYNKPMRKEQISAKIATVKAELMQIGAMRPGTLSQQYSACQKPGCKCVDPIQPQKHGPFYKLSYSHRARALPSSCVRSLFRK
jgi:hypothetical protein